MKIEQIIPIIYFLGSALIFNLGYYIFLKDPKRAQNKIFFILSISATVWGISAGLLFLFYPIYFTPQFIELLLGKETLKVAILGLFSTSGGFFLAPIFLHLSSILTEVKKKKIFYIYFPFLFFFFYDSLLYYLLLILKKGNLPKLYEKTDEIFSFFTLFLFVFYLYLAFYLLFKKFFSLKSRQEKMKFGYFLIGSSIPALPGSVLLILSAFKIVSGLNWIIFFLYILGYLFIGIGVLKHSLFIDYREILETIFESLSEFVVILDKNGYIISANESTILKLGYSFDEIKEKKIEEILGLKMEKILDALKTGVFEKRINFLTKEGKEIPSLLTGSLVKEAVVLVGQDISELVEYEKALEEEVKEKREELEEAKKILEIKIRARTRELRELAKSLQEQVREKTKELQKRLEELERFQRSAVSRELKMVKIKEEIRRLKEKLKKE